MKKINTVLKSLERHDSKNLFFIPPGYAFSDLVARHLIWEASHRKIDLSNYFLIVPNQYSVSVLRNSFLRESSTNNSIILPKIYPITAINEVILLAFSSSSKILQAKI